MPQPFARSMNCAFSSSPGRQLALLLLRVKQYWARYSRTRPWLSEDARQAGDDRLSRCSANRRFHRAIYAHCGNELVAQTLDDISDQLSLGIVSLLWRRWLTWDVEQCEHEVLLQAMTERDPQLVESLLRDHIGNSLIRLNESAESEDLSEYVDDNDGQA